MKAAFFMWISILVVAMYASSLVVPGAESVRSELVRLQADYGIALVSYDRGLNTVSFRTRILNQRPSLPGADGAGAVSRDGTEVALQSSPYGRFLRIARLDGSAGHDFEGIGLPLEMCWSHDKSKLAIVVDKTPPDYSLVILDLRSQSTQEIDVRANVTSQCWSPDDTSIAYDADDGVRIYVLGKNKANVRVIAKGKQATWSSDGKRIAFLDEGTYYALGSTDIQGKALSHDRTAISGLWWSPDSRVVAYISQARILEGNLLPLDVEVYRLRVRRLQDNSQDWVADGVAGGASFQWVANKDLARTAEAVDTRQ